MIIIAQIHQKIQNGLTLATAVEAVIPGADPKFWKKKIPAFNPQKSSTPRRKNSRSRSRKVGKRNFRAPTILARMNLSGTEQQAQERGRTMAELADRVNTRSILVNAGGEFYGVLEVTR